MIIIGIDPGTATTGYGIVNSDLECLGYGIISTPAHTDTSERLNHIQNELQNIIIKFQPNILAVENLYFFKNAKTVIPVSQAKGVIMQTAAANHLPVYEFTPIQVKMAISGYGKATKQQVQKMVQLTLKMDELPRPDDAADALAVASCYIFSSRQKI
jgi:crossover junction endodeoxyribonuclease RuvC